MTRRHHRPPPPPTPTSWLRGATELYVGRSGPGQPLAYRNADGRELAAVEVSAREGASKLGAVLGGENPRHLDERWTVLDPRERELFHLERYEPIDRPSYAVFDERGAPLGTYVGEGVVHHNATVREGASAPVASVDVHHHQHTIRELDGPDLGYCWRTFSAAGNSDDDEIWALHIERFPELLDPRAFLAAPLVCHLFAHPKRHFDPDCVLGTALLIAFPPAGAALLAAERTVDGLNWLRRRLD